jgi:hypothetical protein
MDGQTKRQNKLHAKILVYFECTVGTQRTVGGRPGSQEESLRNVFASELEQTEPVLPLNNYTTDKVSPERELNADGQRRRKAPSTKTDTGSRLLRSGLRLFFRGCRRSAEPIPPEEAFRRLLCGCNQPLSEEDGCN